MDEDAAVAELKTCLCPARMDRVRNATDAGHELVPADVKLSRKGHTARGGICHLDDDQGNAAVGTARIVPDGCYLQRPDPGRPGKALCPARLGRGSGGRLLGPWQHVSDHHDQAGLFSRVLDRAPGDD